MYNDNNNNLYDNNQTPSEDDGTVNTSISDVQEATCENNSCAEPVDVNADNEVELGQPETAAPSYNPSEAPREQVYINKEVENFVYSSDKTEKECRNKEKKPASKGFVIAVAAICVVLSFAAAFGGTLLASKENSIPGINSDRAPLKVETGADNVGVDNAAGEIGLPDAPSIIVPSVGDSNNGTNSTYSSVIKKVADSVVEITTETVSTNSIFSQYITEGAGSGVIISADGYIITNHHVIENASTVTVRTTGGKKYAAEVIGSDSESDLAVLKIEADGLTYAIFGDSSKLVVGDEVIAIGNPLGNLGGTVTNGIISALAREVKISGTQMTLLQTNAAVNPGNSGGGLFNMKGELVGVVNAKSSGSGIEGLAFAIPSNVAANVAEQLAEYGYVRGRVALGISYMDIKDSYTAMMYRVDTYGMYILESEYNDELKVGDRVTAVNGNVITYGDDIKQYLKGCNVGDKITLTVVRDGKYVDVELECYEYVPGDVENDADKTQEKSFGNFFTSPFSGFFW